MELRHLRYFIAAAEEEHFARAADRLHVTRPAVSQIIADLESELAAPLFERLAHRVKLTSAGSTLLPQLQAIMVDLDNAFAEAKRVGEGRIGALRIGYGSLTLMHSIFRQTVKQFNASFPDVTLSLLELPTADQPKALAEGRIDAGFMHLGPRNALLHTKSREGVLAQDKTVLEWIRIQTGDLGVVVPIDHPLAGRSKVTMPDLAHERFVIVPRSSSTPGRGPLYAMCQKAGFEPQIVQEVSTISSQLNLISVGVGIGLSVVGKNFTFPTGLAILPLRDTSYVSSFVFAWVKGQRNPVLDRITDIVKSLSNVD